MIYFNKHPNLKELIGERISFALSNDFIDALIKTIIIIYLFVIRFFIVNYADNL